MEKGKTEETFFFPRNIFIIITILYLQNNTSVTYKNYIAYITGYLLYLQYNTILYFFTR